MRISATRLLALGLLALVAASSVTLTSCRHTVTTEVDTVYVHEPDWDDSTGWVYRASGTTSGLIISQFIDQNLGFVGGDHGTVLRTDDGAETWHSLSSVPVSSESGSMVYGIHFFDARNGFVVGDGYNVWKTTDGGSNWTGSLLSTSYNLRCMSFASPAIGIVGTADAYATPPGMNGELWRTSDGGASWTKVLTISSGSFYHIHFTSATDGFATGKFGAVYWTTDAGLTWTRGTTDQPLSQMVRSAFITPTTGFAVAGPDSNSGFILRTDDAGHNWRTIQSMPYFAQAISANGTGTITAAGFYGNTIESTDNGVTWTKDRLGADRWLDISYVNSKRAVMIGWAGHIVTRDR